MSTHSPEAAPPAYRIDALSVQQLDAYLEQLVGLLQDAVDRGASVGFLPPLSEAAARNYWHKVRAAMVGGNRVLLAALEAECVLAAVQLDLADMPNGRHRAEVMKLFVYGSARRRGIGRALMRAVEGAARKAGRTLLVLDTRLGDTAEQLYRGIGYREAGVIPRYARGASGALEDTMFFYRELETPEGMGETI